jgi:hypothetical protein
VGEGGGYRRPGVWKKVEELRKPELEKPDEGTFVSSDGVRDQRNFTPRLVGSGGPILIQSSHKAHARARASRSRNFKERATISPRLKIRRYRGT